MLKSPTGETSPIRLSLLPRGTFKKTSDKIRTFKRRCSDSEILQSLNDRTEKGILILTKLVRDLDLKLSDAVNKRDYATAVEVAFDKGLITTVQRFFYSSSADYLRAKLINFLKRDRGVAEKVIERIGLGGILCELEKSK